MINNCYQILIKYKITYKGIQNIQIISENTK